MQYYFYAPGDTPALRYALQQLQRQGCGICRRPEPDITHVLLPVPTMTADGCIKGGGNLEEILQSIPNHIPIFGGNLVCEDRVVFDLLQDPVYLAENAAITAHCALKLILRNLPATLPGCSVLIVGWGRIGKCLAHLLKQIGARVTVYARKPADRAMLLALGYDIADLTPPAYDLMRYRIIINTAPVMLLPEELMQHCRPDCLKIELASAPGMAGPDIIDGRGLPSREAPETSGQLIARTVLRLAAGKEQPK